MRFIFLLSLLFCSSIIHAANVTLEFETNQIQGLDGYSENGFEFSLEAGFGVVGYPGNNAFLGTESPGVSTFVFASIDSQPFDLISFDAANWQNYFFEAEMVGNYASGGQIQTIIGIDGGFDSFVFDQNEWGVEIEDWVGLSSLSITVDNTAYPSQLMIDNIVINAVPIPAAAWLFGSALAGLGWLRRKQAA